MALDPRRLAFEVRDPSDLYAPRSAVRELAASLHFQRSDCHELAIVVSELVSNILKYGVRGSVRFEPFDVAPQGAGIRVVARDEGPAFHDLELALRDGFNDRGPIDPMALFKRSGIGAGMGAIVRLSDSFEVKSADDHKEICVVRYRTRPRRR